MRGVLAVPLHPTVPRDLADLQQAMTHSRLFLWLNFRIPQHILVVIRRKVSLRIFVSLAAVAWMAVMCVTSSGAQTTVVKPGSTIRFRLGADDPYHVARLSRLTADSLILAHCETCFGRLGYGRDEVRRLDVSHRAVSSARIGLGALIGGALGAGVGLIDSARCQGGPKCELAAAEGPLLFLIGAAVGGISAYLTAYTWDPVPASASTQR